jgi:hypothetical protein
MPPMMPITNRSGMSPKAVKMALSRAIGLQALMDADVELSASIRRRESVPESPDDADEDGLSLVSTRALHRMLSQNDSEDSLEMLDDNPGADPYDTG